MEVFMTSVSQLATRNQVMIEIAKILHDSSFMASSLLPVNFEVYLFPDRRGGRHHRGIGVLTLPTIEIAEKFLAKCGGPSTRSPVYLNRQQVFFKQSNKEPKPHVVEYIRHVPYLDPKATAEKEKRTKEFQEHHVLLSKLQFGWECRDYSFSAEWERSFAAQSCFLTFDDARRQLRIKINQQSETLVIVIRFSQILWSAVSASSSTIYFTLAFPPAFESEASNVNAEGVGHDGILRKRLTALDDEHSRLSPYISHALRLICQTSDGPSLFKRFSKLAHLREPEDREVEVQDRGCFSTELFGEYEMWLKELPWLVAFQVASLLQNALVDAREILALRAEIDSMVAQQGAEFTAKFLLHFAGDAKDLYDAGDVQNLERGDPIWQCFRQSKINFETLYARTPVKALDTWDSHHVYVTPTRIFLAGPVPERLNRVIRTYSRNYDSFLRVNFVDEDRMRIHFDREVNTSDFVKERWGKILHEGLSVAGRHFEFLAYSQSGLKEHSVYFLKPFRDSNWNVIGTRTVIRGLGQFNNLEFDKELMYCPARFGARISQAFTATEASVLVEAENIQAIDDIKHDGACFTDGVGTISPLLARDIWKKLHARRRLNRRSRLYPRSYQIRFKGSKGVVSVDYKLSGRAICLRPSMIKFEAPDLKEIEIAQVFDKPGRYYLNRPLIMLLEGLGVQYEAFQDFQDAAVADAQEAVNSLHRAAGLLEAHGLGASFRLSSVMLSLDKLGIPLPEDFFFKQMMEFAVHHVLRELKQHARIPIPGGWTLVGVADIHETLKEGEIFACIKLPDSSVTYLSGPVLISRSPTIHPGDVQIAHAIGPPPKGSCFFHEPLPNTVVFSVQGIRPLPSCLGGGDLDGDTYNLIPLNSIPSLRPQRLYQASAYDPAPKKVLPRPSTMDDVSDFIVDYINSDVLGIIAINWLIIADQSTRDDWICDPDCMKLAHLHSHAVDFPKSGQPVRLQDIPKLKFQAKPDWNAPETLGIETAEFYKSQRAIGRLFRSIDLPSLRILKSNNSRNRSQNVAEDTQLEDILDNLHLSDDPFSSVLEEHVADYIDIRADDLEESFEITFLLFQRYVSELRPICWDHSLAYTKRGSAILTEEEAVLGTIVAKCAQPRRRRDLMAKMRERTDRLFQNIREDLVGNEESPQTWLERSWAAWKISEGMGDSFGAKSFQWVALGNIFEAIKTMEESFS